MICPACGKKNIDGVDECEFCLQNLSSLDGVLPTTKFTKALMEDPIAKMKPRDGLWVSPKALIREAIQKMTDNHVGCIFVGNQDQIEGLVTERDILFKVLGKDKKAFANPIRSIMTADPVVLDESDSLAYALNQMSVAGFRHLPIHREGKGLGIISVRDILRHLSKLFPETAA
ncbi:MAG: CBS domain-containing protein [Deltaproteobacteria bacterium]|nr:CBS domain-containing protein [Deltaproteobacteria bacterium]